MYEEKLDKVLYAIYQACKRLPGRISITNVGRFVKGIEPEFDVNEIGKLLVGLEEYGYIELKMYRNGDGRVTLNSHGIRNAEAYEDTLKPNLGTSIKKEIEDFLLACCEKIGYRLNVEFNAYDVGTELGFNREKTDQYYLRLKTGEYLDEISIPTQNNTKSVVTTKGLEAVSGAPFGHPTGVSNVTNNEVNIGGNVTNSAIAAGDGNAQSLSIVTQEQRSSIQELVDKAKTGLPDLNLDADAESDYNDHLSVIEGTLAEVNPQPEVVKKELRGLKRITEGVGVGALGNVTGTGIVGGITALLALLG